MKERETIRRRICSIIACTFITAMTVSCHRSAFDLSGFIYPGNDSTMVPRIGAGEMISVPSGKRLSRGYFSPRGQRLVVFFHGNGESMYHMEITGKKFYEAGYGILLAEYPGYGVSAQYEANEKNIYEDGDALIRHVQSSHSISPRDTVLFGYSLGTGVAVEMASRGLGSKMILIAPYTATYDVAAHYFIPGLPRMLINDIYETKNKAPSITMPVLIIHGKRDKTIPFRMSEELTPLFRDAVMIPVEDAGHEVIVRVTDGELWKAVSDFLAR